jgi:crotonobetaine/carnitine-CoA ligase
VYYLVLMRGGHVKATYAPSETAPWVIRSWAERDPDRPFLHEVNGLSRTYGQVHGDSLRWADSFRRAGVETGDNVAVMVRTSICALEHWLGLGLLRAVRTGVNNDFRGNSLRYVLTNCRARHMICGLEFLDRVAEIAADLPRLEMVIVADAHDDEIPSDFPIRLISSDELWDQAVAAADLPLPQRHEIACITYTSGTTGASKGVLLPWGRMWPDVAWIDLTGDDVYYSPFPVFHMAGLLPLAWLGFPGGQVVLRDSFKTQQFWSDIRRFGCTATALIPAMMNWLLDQPTRDDDLDNPLKLVSGAPIVPRVDLFKKRFGVRQNSVFGTTEVGMPLYAGPDVSADRSSSGKWIASGFEVRVVDDHDYEVPRGEVGELIVRTAQPWRLMCGYFGMPEKTAEAWRNGWFHTGDGFAQDKEGRYHFVDRITDSVRRRGENISSAEIEEYVNWHPAVSECAAIGVPSEYGEDDVKVCVVLHARQSLPHAELHAFLKARMPAFMVPRYIQYLENPERAEAMQRIKKPPLRVDPLNEDTWDADRSL